MIMISKNVIGICEGGGGRIAAGGGLFADGLFAAGLIAGGLFASGLNAAPRELWQDKNHQTKPFILIIHKFDNLHGAVVHYQLCH